MQRNNQRILITADVDESLIDKLSANGFHADIIPFIQTTSIQSKQLQQQIEAIASGNATIIFTSSKAVEAVHKYVQHKKLSWKIYGVGSITQRLIKKLFPTAEILSIADNAAMLAQKIIQHKNQLNELYFFCGDKRRDELPALLAAHAILLHEIEVYKTTILPHTISDVYNAVLFFSPSAVHAFFNDNKVNTSTILFAIGNTTANAIKKYTINKLIISDAPGKHPLINKLITYFSERK